MMGFGLEISEKKRNSNFELLRIICIILIIAHHYAAHGNWDMDNTLSANKFFIRFLQSGGKVGVNCFVLITGYFMVNSSVTWKKIFKIGVQVWFYSIAILSVVVCFNLAEVPFITAATTFLPIIFGKYWFATAYIMLCLLAPFINEFIHNLTVVNYQKLILLLTILLSIIPTLTSAELMFSNVIWFVYLYLLAGYQRLYPLNIKVGKYVYLVIAIVSYLFIFIGVSLFDIMGTKHYAFYEHATYISGISTIPVLLCSISLFYYFSNIEMGSIKWINYIARTTFGIYLIHDNELMRTIIWEKIAKSSLYYESKFLILHASATIVLVFILCMIIESVRIELMDVPLGKLIEKIKFKKVIMFRSRRKTVL
jgi:surface polysaccharide O-acyltransferase-like enzyme